MLDELLEARHKIEGALSSWDVQISIDGRDFVIKAKSSMEFPADEELWGCEVYESEPDYPADLVFRKNHEPSINDAEKGGEGGEHRSDQIGDRLIR